MDCRGLFADESGVYCLLAQKDYAHHHAVGKLIRYEYSDSGLTQKAEKGLNTAALNSAGFLTVNTASFSYPGGFIGSDEQNIYIADDGVNIQYINENWHITGNKNRIGAFNRKTKTGDLTFSNTDATWYTEFPDYNPNTKVLLWKKEDPDAPVHYWTSADGTEGCSEENKLFVPHGSHGDSVSPTDVFCYDQDGNLYILWEHDTGYYVRRFALKEDGSYDKAGEDHFSPLTTDTVSAIAVDISDGENFLYYAYAQGSDSHIKKYKWDDNLFAYAGSVAGYDLTFPADAPPVTALAANKDGLFVAIKESNTIGYTVKVQKYTHDGSAVGSKIQVLGEVLDTGIWSRPGNLTALHIHEGILYGLTAVQYRYDKESNGVYRKNSISGKLVKIGNSTANFSGEATVLHTTELPRPEIHDSGDEADAKRKEGGKFAPYRFIAVKPEKLIITSDGFWGKIKDVNNTNDDTVEQFNFIWDFSIKTGSSLEGRPQSKKAEAIFSKQLKRLTGQNFTWN